MTQSNLPLKYLDADIDNMPVSWKADFDAEVKAGNFLLGGKSLMLRGPEAEDAARHWMACLVLGGFKCYRITPFEAIRRADGKAVMGDDEQRQHGFQNAECILIDDFFDPDAKALTDEMVYLFGWFIRELIRSGVTVIIACDELEPDLSIYSDRIWQVVEENFEVIKHEKTVEAAGSNKGTIKRRKGIR